MGLPIADVEAIGMSRVFFDVSVKIVMRNGQAGVVEIEARDLVTAVECRAALDRAMRGLEALRAEAPAEEMRPAANFRVVG
jgi:hypothetical protein